MKGLAPLALILVLVAAAVSARAQSAPPAALASPFYCFSTGKTVPAGTPMSQLATVCPPSTGQSGMTCSYSYTCTSAQCAQLMGGWSRTLSETGPNVTLERCEEARLRTIPTASTHCVCSNNGTAAAAGATTTGSLAGDALNLGANLWIAQNIKNPYTAKFAQSFSQSFLTSFFSSYNEAQRQRQLMNEALLKQQQEAATKARLAEKQRMDALFARLNSELKLSGSSTNLALKTGGGGSSAELPLKLGETSDGGQKLKLKLGDDSAQGAGINGLPGIYVGGPASAGSANPDTDGLKLKMGDGATTSATAAGPAPAASPGGLGVPGLPGIYLNDVPPERAADLANAAANLSGPERRVAEDAALAAAQKNPALTGPSDDPFVTDYQNEAKTYAEALKTQQDALQKATEAEGHAQASRSVVEYLGARMDPGVPTEAQKQAFQQISLSADSDEALAVEARRTFEQSDIRLSIARDRASDALSGLATSPVAAAATRTPGASPTAPTPSSAGPATVPAEPSAIVDLSRAKQPPVPAILATPAKGGAPLKDTLAACIARASLTREGQRPVPSEEELRKKLESASQAYERLAETAKREDEDRNEWLNEMRKAAQDVAMNSIDIGTKRFLDSRAKGLEDAEIVLHDEIMKTKVEAVNLRRELIETRQALASAKDPNQIKDLADKWNALEEKGIRPLLEKRRALEDKWAGYLRLKQTVDDVGTFRDFAIWTTDAEDPRKIAANDPVAKSEKIQWDTYSDIYWKSDSYSDGIKQLLKIGAHKYFDHYGVDVGEHTLLKIIKIEAHAIPVVDIYDGVSMAIDLSYDVTVGYLGYERLKKLRENDAQYQKGMAALAERVQMLESELECYQGSR